MMQGDLVARSYKREVFQSEEVAVAAAKIKCSKNSRKQVNIVLLLPVHYPSTQGLRKCDFSQDINMS